MFRLDHFNKCPQHAEYFPISGDMYALSRVRYCMDYMSSNNILNCCHESMLHSGFTVPRYIERRISLHDVILVFT